ncbi:hypothetical protein ACFOWA_01300 [Pedobacter lithocola]|uniref:Uncharacterized protein n=1 Tax=Pedobacter lithocola TaxID=1908239 RepID=A0ABV8P5X9_9SPHI
MKTKYNKDYVPLSTLDLDSKTKMDGSKGNHNSTTSSKLFKQDDQNIPVLVSKSGEIKVLERIVPKNGLKGLL